MELRTDVARLTNHLATCQAEKEALEKKLAEQQDDFNRLKFIIDCAESKPPVWFICRAPREEGEIGSSVIPVPAMNTELLDELSQDGYTLNPLFTGISFDDGGSKELTKREAAARQQGFEEGKQAGRDEVVTERDKLFCESIVATQKDVNGRTVCDVAELLNYFNTNRSSAPVKGE